MSALSKMPLQVWILSLSAFHRHRRIGPAAILFAAAIIPVAGLLFILWQEHRVQPRPKTA